MDVLRKAVKKNPKPFGKNSQTPPSSKQHKKLAENWTDTREPVKDGMTFYLKYMGSTLVEELEEGESYGDRVSRNAITAIVNMSKMSGKKLSKVALTICAKGISVVDLETKEKYVEHSIYRICFCTADCGHEKLFAYIARNTENETIECYAFACPKKKVAEAVTLTVAQTFSMAKEEEEHEKGAEIVVQNIANLRLEDKISHSSSPSESVDSSRSNSPMPIKEADLLQLESHTAIVHNAFDEEDEFSSLALSRHQKEPAQSGDNDFSSLFKNQQVHPNHNSSKSVSHDRQANSQSLQIDDLLCL